MWVCVSKYLFLQNIITYFANSEKQKDWGEDVEEEGEWKEEDDDVEKEEEVERGRGGVVEWETIMWRMKGEKEEEWREEDDDVEKEEKEEEL